MLNKIKILVVGKNSFISLNYKKFSKFKNKIKIVSHKNVLKLKLDKFSHIFNLSIDPKIKSKQYKFTNKIDEKICRKIKNKNTIYIFPSTRFIYEKKQKNNFNRLNKIIIENKIKKLIRQNYLILRIGNILAFDLNNKSLFVTKMLNDLKNKNEIRFDLKKNTQKDFITFDYFAKCLDILIEKKIVGTYNFSSGKKTSINMVANSIIKGYGKGKIIFEKNLKNDSFVLNNSDLKRIVKLNLYKKDIQKYCFKIGRNLRKFKKI